MNIQEITNWMMAKLGKDGCLYQDDVVDVLFKSESENLLRENSDGNQVLSKVLLDTFKKETEDNVVWVRSGFYWRLRVPEDEPGRNARG